MQYGSSHVPFKNSPHHLCAEARALKVLTSAAKAPRAIDEEVVDGAEEEDAEELRALLVLPRLEPALDDGGVSRLPPFRSGLKRQYFP